MKAVLIAAGGTGGHVIPAEVLAETLVARGVAVTFLTDARGRRFLKGDGFDVVEVPASKVSGVGFLEKLKALPLLFAGTMKARKLLKAKPFGLIIGFGGYPSVPALAAAKMAGVPHALHEQNAVLGRVNRAYAATARFVALSFSGTTLVPAGPRQALIGTPVRGGIAKLLDAPYAVPEGDAPVHLLIVGGSQGARILSDIVPTALAALPDPMRARLRIVQQVRPEDQARVVDAYAGAGIHAEVATFLNDMPDRLVAAHLVIARAGASTVTEVTLAGRPAIYVPLAVAIDNHQVANVREAVGTGAAVAIEEKDFTISRLVSELSGLLEAPQRLGAMSSSARAVARPGAAEALADLVEEFVRR